MIKQRKDGSKSMAASSFAFVSKVIFGLEPYDS